MGLPALLASALCTFVLPLLLFLAAIKLWDLYCVSSRDRSCSLPLPPGTMGFPFFGETLQMVLQRRKFLQMKRRKYGFIYKTHLFGRPTVRVMGADNVRRILLGEHRLVSVHWPASVRTILGSGCLSNLHDSSHKQRKKVIMQAFSREALQCYVPVIIEEVGSCLERWLSCGERGLLVYPEVKRLMFRIAMRILLGCEPPRAGSGEAEQQLVEAFEEMTRNLFSLPIDVPFSGLYRGMKARNLIHARIEENIRAKICRLRAGEADRSCKDALQLLIEHSWERGERLDMQALKQSSTELLFGGHETTASAATSLITYLGLYPHVLQKVREELKSKGLLCKSNQDNKLDMEILEQLKYIGCVIKETLRLNPPVPGGFRVALKTFELNGCLGIPMAWQLSSPRSSDPKKGARQRPQCLLCLALEVTLHHIHNILLITEVPVQRGVFEKIVVQLFYGKLWSHNGVGVLLC
ncbi:cytochrome P450 26A1 isoform X3 [Marmota monax]|uniref:cytochrome P450 26A1 isoform X3 n=1 Tax=Marmota monax TaxID=9995 RepID=UPI0026F174B8|nr:cytochrome P450 26A1 isoform X3 [Marmota monax]